MIYICGNTKNLFNTQNFCTKEFKIINISIILLIALFLGNIYIINYNYYFALIYGNLLLYHLYIFLLLIKKGILRKIETVYFLITSLFLYITTYFIICDPNPFSAFFVYYTFNPYFIKAILIIIIHTYFLSKYKNYINLTEKTNAFKIKLKISYISDSYFLSDFFKFIKHKISFKYFIFGLILFLFCDAIIFVNRIKIWVYFNKIDKTLPKFYSKNTTFYIASNIVNIENIIDYYIGEMKKLINYLGQSNVIVSIVENGDSKDNTRKYLEDFQLYLSNNKVINKIILKKEIEDPRKINKPFYSLSRLRVEYYAKLRNKCLDLLYEISNIDFENTIVLFFNDIVFRYEDIINLLSTNNEDFDAVCGLDMENHFFFDAWVSVDLDGNSLKNYFPYFYNKEGQDLVSYHKPVRIFSCWNGVIAFKASPLKNKQLKFRHKINYTLPKFKSNLSVKNYYESECTYFNIDLFSLGYSKKFINPDVRVAYRKEGFFLAKYFIPSIFHIFNYFKMYYMNLYKKRNKDMSNYISKEIKLAPSLKKWFLENKMENS